MVIINFEINGNVGAELQKIFEKSLSPLNRRKKDKMLNINVMKTQPHSHYQIKELSTGKRYITYLIEFLRFLLQHKATGKGYKQKNCFRI